MVNYLFEACICAYTSCTDDLLVGCSGSEECLCMNSAFCLAANKKDLGIGMVTESDEICKIGLYICNCGLKKPTTCCAGASKCLCLTQAMSLPFDKDYVASPVCAFCFVQLYPELGVLKEAPRCAAMNR